MMYKTMEKIRKKYCHERVCELCPLSEDEYCLFAYVVDHVKEWELGE